MEKLHGRGLGSRNAFLKAKFGRDSSVHSDLINTAEEESPIEMIASGISKSRFKDFGSKQKDTKYSFW